MTCLSLYERTKGRLLRRYEGSSEEDIVFFFCFVSANVMHVPRLQDNGQACPICREFYVDAFSTLCGHTFCFRCITRHLQHTGACPCCRQLLSSETLFPNLALDKLLHGLPKTYQVPPSAEASEAPFIIRVLIIRVYPGSSPKLPWACPWNN